MKNIPGVYVVKNLVNGKVYVGSSVKVRDRILSHKRGLKTGKHGNQYMLRAWVKYGEASFTWEVVEECTAEGRLVWEQWWIDHLKADQEEFGYNLIPTRKSQLYGSAMSVHQKAGWAKLTPEQRREANAHLNEPEIRAACGKKSGETRSSPDHIERQRKIAETYLTTPENRKGNSDRLKEKWQDPEFRAARLAGLARGRAKTNANPTPKMLAALTKGREKAIDQMVAKARARRAGNDIV